MFVILALNFGGKATQSHSTYMRHFSFIAEAFLENVWKGIYQHHFLKSEHFKMASVPLFALLSCWVRAVLNTSLPRRTHIT